MKKLVIALTLLLAGCASSTKYVEGTHFALGAYIPVESSLYGVEICQYLNGCCVKASSNTTFHVKRDYAATNSYFFGMVETREKVHTIVETKK
jgi:hypothetical protein